MAVETGSLLSKHSRMGNNVIKICLSNENKEVDNLLAQLFLPIEVNDLQQSTQLLDYFKKHKTPVPEFLRMNRFKSSNKIIN